VTPDAEHRLPLVGVIGCGAMGSAVAELFTGRGLPVYLAGRRHSAAQELAAGLPRAAAVSVEVAAEKADVLILATSVVVSCTQIAPRVGSRLVGKVLVDVSNPEPEDLEDTGHRSAAEVIAEVFTGSSVVKALNCVSARQVRAVARGGRSPTVPITGDDRQAKRSVARLLRRSGFDVADAGPLAGSRWVEGLSHLLRRLGQEEGLGDAVGFHLLRLAPALPSLSEINASEKRRT
jgi:predicted dinucleotide-binding enzyme